MPVTTLFETLSDEPAPESLELALERATVVAGRLPSDGNALPDGDGEGPHDGSIVAYHSDAEAEKFADLYCGSSHNLYCRLHITGRAQRTTDTKVKQAGAIVRPYVGSVGLQLLFYKNGSWRNIQNVTVNQGKVRHLLYANWEQGTGPIYAQHQVRMIIDDAEDNWFDYSFWAHDGAGVAGTTIPTWD
jgi:hypothetical protein